MKFSEYLSVLILTAGLLFTPDAGAADEQDIQQSGETLAQDTAENSPAGQKEAEPVFLFAPVQISFYSPLQLFEEDTPIYGLKLNFPYGKNKILYGIDVGLVNETDTLYGISCAALFSQRAKEMYGMNFSGFMTLSSAVDTGISLAGIYNSSGTVRGLQISALCNQAKKVNGVQISLFNQCNDMNGMQIGLLNYCRAQPFKYTFLMNFWASKEDSKKRAEKKKRH